MDAHEFNKIDKNLDKLKKLSELSIVDKIILLESQINNVYYNWNNSVEKINDMMKNNICINLEEKIIFYDLFFSKSIWVNKQIDYPEIQPERTYQWMIFNCDLGHNIGSEQNKKRPVIILNDTFFTKSSIMIVAPITGSGKKLYNPEVDIAETKYNNVSGKVDLSQMRSVSYYRFDNKPIDRLMNKEEYKTEYGSKQYTMIQTIIIKKIKNIFGIDI